MVLKMWLAGSPSGRATIIVSMSSVVLHPPSSAPHRMLVHWSRMLGVSSSTSLFFSYVKGSTVVSARLRMPLALFSTWCRMCKSTFLYITWGLTTGLSSMTTSASLNQVDASFSQKPGNFTL